MYTGTPYGYTTHMATQVFTVTGMSCEHCVRSVTEEVSKLSGVRTVDVDLGSGAVAVTADRELSDSEISEAVDEAGYELVRDSSEHPR
jgi:copper chaperone